MYKASKYNKFYFEKDAIFLFNSCSRACVQVEKKEIEKIKAILRKKEPCKGKDKEVQDLLLENRFIISDDINELESLEYAYTENFFRTEVINVALLPTLQCNFKCPYCFEAGHKKVKGGESKDYFTILEKFADQYFVHRKRVHISFFGGEPLLKKDELFSYMDYLLKQSKKNNYELVYNIATNGYLLDRSTIRTMYKYTCDSLQITLDGKKESHNKLRILHNGGETFDIIVNNLKAAIQYAIKIKAKTHFILRINLFNQTVDDIKTIFNSFTAEERKRIDMIFRPVFKTDCFSEVNENTSRDLKKFNDEAAKHGFGVLKGVNYLQCCEADGGINFFYITPDLKMWKCLNNMSIETANIGFIDKTGTIQLNPNMAKWYQTNSFKDEKCRRCYLLPLCFGGCPLNYAKTGKRRCKTKDMAINPYFYPTIQ
jgi:uncharacterized protein